MKMREESREIWNSYISLYERKKEKNRRLKIIKCISTLAILVVQCMHRRTGPNSTERIVS